MTSRLFCFLEKLIQHVKSTDAKMALANYCGILASRNYCGTFRSVIVEQFFETYSLKFKKHNKTLKSLGTKQLVHVFTTTYTTGGHTRFLENLVNIDDNYTHHLLVTNQGETPARTSLFESIKAKGGKIHFIKGDHLDEQVHEIHEFISENASNIVLHIHQYDSLPSIALNAFKGEIDIHFFNHADHSFSFGCDVSNSVINIRQEAQRISQYKRNQLNSQILPLLILKDDSIVSNRKNIREKYGIQDSDIVGVSIGNPLKFYKTEKHYFFQTIVKALEQNLNLKVFIVGVGLADFCEALGVVEHERLKFLGLIPDPSELQLLADIALDPMPLGSYTALLETCYYGAYPMVCFDTIPLFDLYKDEAFKGHFNIDLNEKAYLEHLKKVCERKINYSKDEISAAIKTYHCGKEWLQRFSSIIEKEISSDFSSPLSDEEILRFYELNQPWKEVQNTTLSFFYENIQLFTKKEVIKIVLHLTFNRYSVREILGIVKKRVIHK